MTTLILVRHAETDMTGRFCGHCDPELNERGRKQLAGIASRMSDYSIRQIYTSDLRRARQTTQTIAASLGVGVEVRPGLREIHFGLWEGRSWAEIEASDPFLAKGWAEHYPYLTAPGGESFDQFERRVREETAFLCAAATESSIAVVSHAGFIRVLLTSCCRIPEEDAWKLTKEYGSVVPVDANLLLGYAVEESACQVGNLSSSR